MFVGLVFQEPQVKHSANRFPRLLGILGGHVDDFHCTGPHSEEWSTIYAQT